MIIRKLKNKDLNSLYQLGQQAFPGEYWMTKKFIFETLNESGHHYGIFLKNDLIGAIMTKKYDRPKLWIFFFVVKENHRRQGIGSVLLKKIETKCTNEFPMLFVDMESKDYIAKNFYKKHNFKKCGEVKDWFGLGNSGILYSKQVI